MDTIWLAYLLVSEEDTVTELMAACFWAWNWADTAENTAGSRAAITWLVSSCFWAAETELEDTEELESDWVKVEEDCWEDWRARATCCAIWGVSTARIWEVIADSELELWLELE